jgi:hypothetical protein
MTITGDYDTPIGAAPCGAVPIDAMPVGAVGMR